VLLLHPLANWCLLYAGSRGITIAIITLVDIYIRLRLRLALATFLLRWSLAIFSHPCITTNIHKT
jgi:hypothetical protein